MYFFSSDENGTRTEYISYLCLVNSMSTGFISTTVEKDVKIAMMTEAISTCEGCTWRNLSEDRQLLIIYC
jgi:hypothetical protein